MRTRDRISPLAALLVAVTLAACDKPTTPTRSDADPGSPTSEAELEAADAEDANATGETVEFADAQLFFELNSTDNDLGLQLFLDTDDGWKRVRVLDPSRNDVIEFETAGKLSRLGLTELRFESSEPSPEEVLALLPPGQYRFRGRTVEGDQLASNATLSHDFQPAPTITPSAGEVVDPEDLVVRWTAPEAERVEIIIEQDELEDVFDVTFSGEPRRLRIPRQFLRPGLVYKIEILSIAENGNRIITEGTFETAP
jgi:hypothetical protein